jgi:hypothetical protein
MVGPGPLFGGSPGWLDDAAIAYKNIKVLNDPFIKSSAIYDKNVSDIVKMLEMGESVLMQYLE